MLTERISRPLSRRESQIVAWLEEERPPLITAADLAENFEFKRDTATDILRRMAAKGWLQRVGRGTYAPLLADTGGIAVPNPWAALAAWKAAYYVSYASAAYELGLTPDRPGSVQTCVRVGKAMPPLFTDLPITLIYQPHFSLRGSAVRTVQGVNVRIAQAERVLVDSAIRPSRVGGTLALGRITRRALETADWGAVASIAAEHPRGHAAARRLATLIDVLAADVPDELARFAGENLPNRPMPLDDPKIYGWRGERNPRFAVLVNVPAESLREELRR
jgi:predicted transcriptional regulator of viral defense system